MGPYRFFFYSSDFMEPIHIHVRRESMQAKFWLHPVRLASNSGFSTSEIGDLYKLVASRENEIYRRWNEFFQNKY
jgi:hypothetical protein